jgi:hypothetical protein
VYKLATDDKLHHRALLLGIKKVCAMMGGAPKHLPAATDKRQIFEKKHQAQDLA